MKITTLFLLASFFCLPTYTYSQNYLLFDKTLNEIKKSMVNSEYELIEDDNSDPQARSLTYRHKTDEFSYIGYNTRMGKTHPYEVLFTHPAKELPFIFKYLNENAIKTEDLKYVSKDGLLYYEIITTEYKDMIMLSVVCLKQYE